MIAVSVVNQLPGYYFYLYYYYVFMYITKHHVMKMFLVDYTGKTACMYHRWATLVKLEKPKMLTNWFTIWVFNIFCCQFEILGFVKKKRKVISIFLWLREVEELKLFPIMLFCSNVFDCDKSLLGFQKCKIIFKNISKPLPKYKQKRFNFGTCLSSNTSDSHIHEYFQITKKSFPKSLKTWTGKQRIFKAQILDSK